MKRKKRSSFYRWCERQNACESGLDWIEDRSYPQIYAELTNPCWLIWLIIHAKEGRKFSPELQAELTAVAREANHGGYVSLSTIDRDSVIYTARSLGAHSFSEVCDAIRKHVGKRPAIHELWHKKSKNQKRDSTSRK